MPQMPADPAQLPPAPPKPSPTTSSEGGNSQPSIFQ